MLLRVVSKRLPVCVKGTQTFSLLLTATSVTLMASQGQRTQPENTLYLATVIMKVAITVTEQETELSCKNQTSVYEDKKYL